MNEEELIRYSRHILLPEFGLAKQEKLLASHVAIIGLGGLGTPAAMYLAASGIGKLTLIDFDTIELQNLQRQIAYTENDIGHHKAAILKDRLQALNNQCQIIPISEKLTEKTLPNIIAPCHLIIDATDNFATRFIINRECVAQKKMLVSGAAIGWQGQLLSFDFHNKHSPCYQCIFPDSIDDREAARCSESSVISPLVGVIGSLQALSAIKLLTDCGKNTFNFKLFDAHNDQWRQIHIVKDDDCEVCGEHSPSRLHDLESER